MAQIDVEVALAGEAEVDILNGGEAIVDVTIAINV
jgi:hypothetical protein